MAPHGPSEWMGPGLKWAHGPPEWIGPGQRWALGMDGSPWVLVRDGPHGPSGWRRHGQGWALGMDGPALALGMDGPWAGMSPRYGWAPMGTRDGWAWERDGHWQRFRIFLFSGKRLIFSKIGRKWSEWVDFAVYFFFPLDKMEMGNKNMPLLYARQF